MIEQKCIIATRKSPLAMAQTEMARDALASAHPDWALDLLPLSTTGDRQLEWSLEAKGGKGLFTSELEKAILERRADIAVHSAKDLPTEMDAGLELAGFLPRERAVDVLVIREGVDVPKTIATGSPRRRAQLSVIFPHAEWREIRGNVGTRMQKILDGHADATVMAAAGLIRLGIEAADGLRFEPLTVADCVPAAGQGAIAIQCRSGEAGVFQSILCPDTALAVTIERAALSLLGGGCHSASAAFWTDGMLSVFDGARGRRDFSLEPAGVDEIHRRIQEHFQTW